MNFFLVCIYLLWITGAQTSKSILPTEMDKETGFVRDVSSLQQYLQFTGSLMHFLFSVTRDHQIWSNIGWWEWFRFQQDDAAKMGRISWHYFTENNTSRIIGYEHPILFCFDFFPSKNSFITLILALILLPPQQSI